MAAVALALASAVAYLLIGWKIAMRMLPRFWTAARRQWSFDDSIRGSVKAQTICAALFWVFLLPALAVSRLLGTVIDAGDPEALEERIRDRDRRIAELEHELKIQP